MPELIISVAEIVGRPGESREMHLSAVLEGVGTALASLDRSPVEASLRADSVVEGVLVTGSVEGHMTLECARCLTSFAASVSVQVCDLFTDPDSEDVAEEIAYPIRDRAIDLEPMLRDALTLTLPLKPLCTEACKGLCAHCGRDLNAGLCTCGEDAPDPRWAALGGLRNRLEESSA
ncbi:MAG: DUF177 domain-containing protein [Actinobacteria bacterium]|nr:DUF177 domain-containing protein [Actinomycetota bacterium]